VVHAGAALCTWRYALWRRARCVLGVAVLTCFHGRPGTAEAHNSTWTPVSAEGEPKRSSKAPIQPACDLRLPTRCSTEAVQTAWCTAWGQVDIAVVEAGLGGARDATNVFPAPDGDPDPARPLSGLRLAVITAIGLEHQARPGVCSKVLLVLTMCTNRSACATPHAHLQSLKSGSLSCVIMLPRWCSAARLLGRCALCSQAVRSRKNKSAANCEPFSLARS